MDDLQFQKAEFADSRPKCTLCAALLEKTYFHLNGQVVCPACAEKAQAAQQRPEHSWVLRGTLYGVGAAILCSIGYAIFTWVTNMEVALIVIGVGYVVGQAVRKGSRGLGGRRCQVAAVLLTYFAITMSYVPLLIKGARERTEKAPSDSKKGARPSDGASAAPSSSKGDDVGAGQPAQSSEANVGVPKLLNSAADQGGPFLALLVAAGLIAGLAMLAPFFGVMSGVSGIIGLVIIFFGLQQAWKQTARDQRAIMGPYPLEEEAPAVG